MKTRWMYNLKKLNLYLGYNANKYLGINLPETQFLILLRDLSKYWFSILFLPWPKKNFPSNNTLQRPQYITQITEYWD